MPPKDALISQLSSPERERSLLSVFGVATLGLLGACGAGIEPVQIQTGTIKSTTSVVTIEEPDVDPEQNSDEQVDFDRPVTQSIAKIATSPTIEEWTEFSNDIRGQTISVSDQMQRAIEFPDVTTIEPAQILHFSISYNADDLDDIKTETHIGYHTPVDGKTVAEQIETNLWSRGLIVSEKKQLAVGGRPVTSIVVGTPGIRITEEQFVVEITSDPPTEDETALNDPTTVKLSHLQSDPANNPSDLLVGWLDDARLPSSAILREAELAVDQNSGKLSARYEIKGDDVATARAQFERRIDSKGWTLSEAVPVDPTAFEPIAIFDPDDNLAVVEFSNSLRDDVIVLVITAEVPVKPF